ncbi:MAG: hypothetical protein HY055_09630 [Magnetospirillum sp.]|nr:hypothetical protein [Magnetospirillum sp.]
MRDTCTQLLDDLLTTAQLWLGPMVEAECRHQDAAKLRTFVVNLRDARDRVAVMEGKAAPDGGLSASLRNLSSSVAKWPDGAVLYARSIRALEATLDIAAAQADALELALRALGNTESDEDLEILALATILHRGGVRRAIALAQPVVAPPGGDAA